MKKLKHKKDTLTGLYKTWLVPGVIGLVFLGLIVFVIRIMLSDDAGRKQEKIASITLIKPPPDVKEKPPEPPPQVQKEIPKETIATPQESPQSPQNQAQDQSQDNTPAGSDLGVDGEGGAGSDGFGLVGKKGGRGLIGGGNSGGANRLSLLAKYGWYTQKVQDEIRNQVKKRLEREGGYPKGKNQALVKIFLDQRGAVVKFSITGTSGNERIDKAVLEAIRLIRISEPPPEGMPSGMNLKISLQG